MADILGGIIRGLSNNKTSLALQQSNVKGPNNPLTGQWIGTSQNVSQVPAGSKDSTQGMAIPWGFGSPGNEIGFAQLVPMGTDIAIAPHPIPSQEVNIGVVSSQLGSNIQRSPASVPMGLLSNATVEMNPQNSDHWSRYYANQIGQTSWVHSTNPGNVLTAISNQSNSVADGVPSAWGSYDQILLAMRKSYTPSNAFFGGNPIPPGRTQIGNTPAQGVNLQTG